MANTKSAKKRIRQTIKKTKINNRYREGIKYLKRKTKLFIKRKDSKEDINELLRKFYSIVDKAAKRNVVHKNKAARLKSRITKLLRKSSYEV